MATQPTPPPENPPERPNPAKAKLEELLRNEEAIIDHPAYAAHVVETYESSMTPKVYQFSEPGRQTVTPIALIQGARPQFNAIYGLIAAGYDRMAASLRKKNAEDAAIPEVARTADYWRQRAGYFSRPAEDRTTSIDERVSPAEERQQE